MLLSYCIFFDVKTESRRNSKHYLAVPKTPYAPDRLNTVCQYVREQIQSSPIEGAA